MKKEYIILWIMGISIILLVLTKSTKTTVYTGNALAEEPDFDYSNQAIMDIANNIKQTNSNDNERIKASAKFVYDHVTYDPGITISECKAETASSVLQRGTGDCVSMSRLLVALLRAQGIQARTVGGCLSQTNRCTPTFSAVGDVQPKTVQMTEGDYKKRGFLHEWVEAYDGSNWVVIEATAGLKFDLNCNQYKMYGYDSNSDNRCTINDNDFWRECTVW